MLILNQLKALFLALIVLIFILLPTCLVAFPFSLKRRLKIIGPIWSLCSRIMLRYGCQSKISVQKDLRSAEFKKVPPSGLFIANHQSYLDIPLMLTMYQVPPIMKKEVLYIPLFGWLAWISGALPVARGKYGSRKKVFEQTKKRVLEEQIGLQVYPEGTRSKDSLPKEFKDVKRTLLMFAYDEKIPVIPTSLYGTRGTLSKHGLIRPNRHLGIIVHKELFPADFNSSEEFCRACWEKVREGHREMKDLLGAQNGN